jgi:cell division septation protein DedD
MSEPANWQASLLEQRMAWGIAASCIILVLLVFARPEWFEFDFSTPQHAPVASPVLTAQATHAASQQHKTQPKTLAKPHAAAVKKSPTAHSKTKTKPSPHPVKKHTAIADGFYIQLGAFHERPRAQGLADQLKRSGWAAVITTKPGGLHAVWVGPKTTRSEAEKLSKAIHRKFKNKGFIVHKKRS